MPVEFIGLILHRRGSDLQAFVGQGDFSVDRGYVRRFAQVHEDAGFDRALIGTASIAPEGSQVAAYATAHTERLSPLVSHRPGFRAPTVAARELATLDHFSNGRAAVHIITGGSDAEQRRDGDFVGKDERYARTDRTARSPSAASASSRPPRRAIATTVRSGPPSPRSWGPPATAPHSSGQPRRSRRRSSITTTSASRLF
jgi:alkanesulfonate monooxygenase